MIDCRTLFVVEGPTDLPLLRALLTRLYSAADSSPLVIDVPPGPTTNSSRTAGATRAKYRLGDSVIGLYFAGGRDDARRAIKDLVQWVLQDLFPELVNVVLVRDLNASSASALNQGLAQQLRELAGGEGAEFESIGSGPWLCRVRDVAVGQILLGDPSTPGNAAIEDHILDLLRLQPERDPSDLSKVVRSHLPSDPSPKQEVQLAMVRDGYWTAAAGFYERVLSSAPDDQLKSLADRIGFTELMQRLTDELTEG